MTRRTSPPNTFTDPSSPARARSAQTSPSASAGGETLAGGGTVVLTRGEDQDSGHPSGVPLWLEVEPEPVYATLHVPRGAAPTRTAALILPMFGWDNDCSYRARRCWATRLAQSGVTTARIDFPGTENSFGSPLRRGRFQSWIDATGYAAGWLRQVSGCDRLVVIGIGIGGLIAYQAAAQGGPIDDLVLWASRASGRAHLRELLAYATVASGEIGDEAEAPRSDGEINIAGHVISEETAAALKALSISGPPLPHAQRRRVLLIGRGAHGVDNQLHEHLAGSQANVTVMENADYEALVALPELRMTPDETISASIAWLQKSTDKSLEPIPHAESRSVPATSDHVELEHQGSALRERILELDIAAGRLVGILTEPAEPARPAPYCLIAVNAGELRHTGPNRLAVEVSRLAAAAGIPMARVDLPGLGDSDGRSARTFDRTHEDDSEILRAIADIQEHLCTLGVAEQFVPVGLCLGAYYAIRSALDSPRSIGAIAINPPTFRWRRLQQETLRKGLRVIAPDVVAPRRPRAGIARALAPVTTRVAHACQKLELSARRRLARLSILWRFARRAGAVDAADTLERLAHEGTRVLLLLSEDETVLRLLEQPKLAARVEAIPTVRLQQLPTRDHILRPLPSQAAALRHIAVALREFFPQPPATLDPDA